MLDRPPTLETGGTKGQISEKVKIGGGGGGGGGNDGGGGGSGGGSSGGGRGGNGSNGDNRIVDENDKYLEVTKFINDIIPKFLP